MRRLFYTLLVVLGTILLFLILFIAVVEITTSASLSGLMLWLTLAAAMFAVIHVFREARSTKRLSWTAWVAYTLAMGLLMREVWVTINDPSSKLVFAVMAFLSSIALLTARILRTIT